jgi:hypothetical protein
MATCKGDMQRGYPKRGRGAPKKSHSLCNVRATCARPSANHELPGLSVAVALRCMQLGRTQLLRVQVCAGIQQRLNVLLQPGRRRQEERRVAASVAQMHRGALREKVAQYLDLRARRREVLRCVSVRSTSFLDQRCSGSGVSDDGPLLITMVPSMAKDKRLHRSCCQAGDCCQLFGSRLSVPTGYLSIRDKDRALGLLEITTCAATRPFPVPASRCRRYSAAPEHKH